MNADTSDTYDIRDDRHFVNIINTEASTDKPIYNPLALVELICEQENNVFCQTAAAQVRCANNESSINSEEPILMTINCRLCPADLSPTIASKTHTHGIISLANHWTFRSTTHYSTLRPSSTRPTWPQTSIPSYANAQEAQELTPNTAIDGNCSSFQHLDLPTLSQWIS